MPHLEVLERFLGRPLDHVERHDDVGPPADERLQKRHLDAARLWGTSLIVQEGDVGTRDVVGHRVETDEGPACRGKNPLRSHDRLAAERDRRQHGHADGGDKSHRYFSNFE